VGSKGVALSFVPLGPVFTQTPSASVVFVAASLPHALVHPLVIVMPATPFITCPLSLCSGADPAHFLCTVCHRVLLYRQTRQNKYMSYHSMSPTGLSLDEDDDGTKIYDSRYVKDNCFMIKECYRRTAKYNPCTAKHRGKILRASSHPAIQARQQLT